MRNFSVEFGTANSGLATVGVTQLRRDGTAAVARATSGVADHGGGVYGADIELDPACTALRWDTGTAQPLYAVEDTSIPPGASLGGAMGADASNSPLAVSSFVRLASHTLPGGAMGKNGTVAFQLRLKYFAYVYVTLAGQTIYADAGLVIAINFSITNRNSTQAQLSTGLAPNQNVALRTTCNTDVGLPLEVYVKKANAADDVALRYFTYQIYYNNETQIEASYLATSGVMEVTESDLLLPTLPPRVTGDPQKSIRSLASSDYQFPGGFFSVASKTWPLRESALPVPTSLLRTRDWPGTGWQTMQTAQATAAYTPVTGPAPPGISAAGLADLDALFAAAAVPGGVAPVVNLLSEDNAATPAWVAALGGACNPLAIPPAGANRDALLASIAYYAQYIVQRYTKLYPALNWYIEPIHDPATTWSGAVGDLFALVGAVSSAVVTYGTSYVHRLCSSWTDWLGVTYMNFGAPPAGSLTPTLHEYIGYGAWDQFDILTYRLYNGRLGVKDLNPSNPYGLQALYSHNLKLLDPTLVTSATDRPVSLPALLTAHLGRPGIVPGTSLAGKPLWITECGDAYAAARDKNFYIRLALIASALGVSKYIFYYYGGLRYGSLPSMDIENCRQAYMDAHDFLSGKTVNFVNVNDDFSKVGAGINGQVYLF